MMRVEALSKLKSLLGILRRHHTGSIVESLKEEILERTNMYLAGNAPRAAMAMVGATS
jgi:hypothetical protein